MKLDSRELGTVLAALRLWQIHTADEGEEARCPEPDEWAAIDEIAPNALSRAEIDDLCERINCVE